MASQVQNFSILSVLQTDLMMHFKPWLRQKEKSCLLSVSPPWLQSFFGWFFCLLTCLSSKYEESSPKNSSKVFFSSSSPLSTIPFYVFLWQLCSTDTEWGILTQQSPAQSRCWLPCSLLNFLYFYLQEHPDRLCLEFWSTERIFSSLELSRPSCKGVLGFKPS